MTKYQDEAEDDDDVNEWGRDHELRDEDKVYYGSDSDDVDHSDTDDYGDYGEELGESEMEFEYEYYEEEDDEDIELQIKKRTSADRSKNEDGESMEFDGPEEEGKLEDNAYQ